MDCRCNSITKLTPAKIRHVYGNVLRIAVPLTMRTVEVVDGVVSVTDTDFTPSTDYPISIIFDKGAAKAKYIATLRGDHIAYIEDKGTLEVGTYSITVLCKDSNGNPYRFKERAVLQVVDATADAGIEKGIEYEVKEHYLDSAVFFASGAADRGIDHIDTSTEGNTVTVTFYLTDGSMESFSVKSGIEMLVDQDWDITSERAIANKVVTGFHDYVMGKESYVSGETLNIEW